MRAFIVDVETTGTDPVNDRVIEVGVVVMDDFQVKETFTTLVNPGRPIPSSIKQLTGINDHMVRSAPSFTEIADKLATLANGRIFVAQNVMFDHGFLAHEFRRTGSLLNTDQLLCTRDLSMSIWPGSGSHRLSAIGKRLNYENKQPHRALPDAQVISEFLSYVYKFYGSRSASAILQRSLRSRIKMNSAIGQKISGLPESTGVYYLIDRYGRPLYIGKAINLRQRVRDHFTGGHGQSLISRNNETIDDIRFNVTYEEALASILEDQEIRQHWPRFNSAQKRPVFRYSVHNYYDRNQNGRIRIIRSVNSKGPVFYFRRGDAEQYVREIVSSYSMSGDFCGVEGHETLTPAEHNTGFAEYRKELIHESDFVTIFSGPLPDNKENYLVITRDGHTIGIGFTDNTGQDSDLLMLKGIKFNRYFRINPGPVVQQITQKLIRSGAIGSPVRIRIEELALPKSYSNFPSTRSRFNHSLFL